VGAEKPSPIIFEEAVQLLGVTPPECVHVGDDRRNDVWGGRCVRIMIMLGWVGWVGGWVGGRGGRGSFFLVTACF